MSSMRTALTASLIALMATSGAFAQSSTPKPAGSPSALTK